MNFDINNLNTSDMDMLAAQMNAIEPSASQLSVEGAVTSSLLDTLSHSFFEHIHAVQIEHLIVFPLSILLITTMTTLLLNKTRKETLINA